MFLEKRVYQGSSGRVYPLPCTDRIAAQPTPRAWQAVWLENEYLRLLILPELGGRIHRAQDKTTGYDFIYHQTTIKPALVGLAGPWVSGGIEFNWPQHHRPTTFMPAEVSVERHASGAVTVWLGEHEPMTRMKGMHGVRLEPGRAAFEVVARVYNRTSDIQTFLWWANAAVRVHEEYQSFFPPDVTEVADHAKRATSSFPLCHGRYYGVDYGRRASAGIPPAEIPARYIPRNSLSCPKRKTSRDNFRAPNDLSWYANIPVPTSYMCVGSRGDFGGGYDHREQAGFVHVANRHIVPGKKQWTWGNHEFGYSWDRNLTEPDKQGDCPPYIELMFGAYTDNQPDFSFLNPGETKSWSQWWYPIRKIGPASAANRDVALSFRIVGRNLRVGVAVVAAHENATVRVFRGDRPAKEWAVSLRPGKAFLSDVALRTGLSGREYSVVVSASDGRELIRYSPAEVRPIPPIKAATEPPAAGLVGGNDELFLIGTHLEQYRHATRRPEEYWLEAVRRDPSDARCNLALGRWHLRRGEFPEAESRLRRSLDRLVGRNPNPPDGEVHYQLGLCHRYQAFANGLDKERMAEAYDSFYKATWNQAWQGAGFHALTEIDMIRGDYETALQHVDRSLLTNSENLNARVLKAVILRKIGRDGQAESLLEATHRLDRLDAGSRFFLGKTMPADIQTRLDLALDLVRAGLFEDADSVCSGALIASAMQSPVGNDPQGIRPPDASTGTVPLIHYYRAWIASLCGNRPAERAALARAAAASPDYCFPSRVEEIMILERAIKVMPDDANAPLLLGNLLYDRRRHRDAIVLWQRATRLDPLNSVAWRNLGLAYHNIEKNTSRSRAAYERAVRSAPRDARLLFEYDQLRRRLGDSPAARLRTLRKRRELVRSRDDLSIEFCALCTLTGTPAKSAQLLAVRHFQPWEGGEGRAIGEHVRAQMRLGWRFLENAEADHAVRCFEAALVIPRNLGESRHLLANISNIKYWLGNALARAGDTSAAAARWREAAEVRGDFKEMSVCAFSELTYYSARALQRLGKQEDARRLLSDLRSWAVRLASAPAKVDYFATSLPTMLLFDDDLRARNLTTSRFIRAQVEFARGRVGQARAALARILRDDPGCVLAADFAAEIATEQELATIPIPTPTRRARYAARPARAAAAS